MKTNSHKLVVSVICIMCFRCHGFSHPLAYFGRGSLGLYWPRCNHMTPRFWNSAFRTSSMAIAPSIAEPARQPKSALSMIISRDAATLADAESDRKISSDSDSERRFPVTEYFKPLVQGDRLESTVSQRAIVAGSTLLIFAMIYQAWHLCQLTQNVNLPIMAAAVILGYEFADFGSSSPS